MNLYGLHTNPETLVGYDQRLLVPDLAYSLMSEPGGETLTPQEMDIAEHSIAKDPMLAAEYAIEVLEERFLEAEPVIMKHPGAAFMYAGHQIGGRWPEAEPYIKQDPKYASMYANNILQKRWPEAEKYIKQDPRWWKNYQNYQRNILDEPI